MKACMGCKTYPPWTQRKAFEHTTFTSGIVIPLHENTVGCNESIQASLLHIDALISLYEQMDLFVLWGQRSWHCWVADQDFQAGAGSQNMWKERINGWRRTNNTYSLCSLANSFGHLTKRHALYKCCSLEMNDGHVISVLLVKQQKNVDFHLHLQRRIDLSRNILVLLLL